MKKDFMIIAGPCVVESKEQIIRIAKSLKEIGVDVLRGGHLNLEQILIAFKAYKMKILNIC